MSRREGSTRQSVISMQRNTEDLCSKEFDIVVVGAGIYGAATARDAALRGLSIAIIDGRDFCGATSANSLKIIHGGMRYLQQLDFPRVLESCCERRNMMRIASHLVHPMPSIMPTRGHLLKSREAMAAGLLLYEILTGKRNTLRDREKNIPRGRVISKSECLKIIPGLAGDGITGGVIWYDACAFNTERLVVSMVRSAVDSGAVACNYTRMTGFIGSSNRVKGIKAEDMLSGDEVEVRARLVINNTGPWVNETLNLLDAHTTKPLTGLSMAMNFVLKRQLFSSHAVGLSCPVETGSRERLLFFVPWGGRTMVGTYYRSHEGHPDRLHATEEDIDLFLADLNKAYPEGNLAKDDIALIHAGLLPTKHLTRDVRDPELLRHYRILDHGKHDHIEGLISVLGVKYTTARDVAEKTIDLACRKLRIDARPSSSAKNPMPGGDIGDFKGLLAEADLDNTARRLVYNYGMEYRNVVNGTGNLEDTLEGEVQFILDNEMPQTLSDLIFRRTDLAISGMPGDETLLRCARIMARHLGWDRSRIEEEVRQTKDVRFPGSETFNPPSPE